MDQPLMFHIYLNQLTRLFSFVFNSPVCNISSPRMDAAGDDNISISKTHSSNSEQEKKHNVIWRLFREAQQNILYLNNQRLSAVEELKVLKREKQLLLDKLDQLKVANQVNIDMVSPGWELLLRLDSMTLTGMIDIEEASTLRRLVMDSKVSLMSVRANVFQGNAELLKELRSLLVKKQKRSFHIVHICTEMAPLVCGGALASYVTGLSQALQRNGNFVEVILPKYASLDLDEIQGLQEMETEFYSYYNGQLHGNKVWTGVTSGIGVTFLQPLKHSSFFLRERVYGYSDDFERFSYFSRASLDYIVKSGKQPDVLHIHNWHTAIVAPLFWDIFVKQGLENTRILLTCHGFDDQCLEEPHKLALCGLDPSRLHRADRFQDNTKMHLVNILKAGIVYSNKVIVMSSMQSKARFIRSMGRGLEPTLETHREKLLISPYGFDDTVWDPSTDKFLPAFYTSNHMEGKAACKLALQRHVELPEFASAVIVGCIVCKVSDIDMEKLRAAVLIACKEGIQLILMGLSRAAGMKRILESFQEEIKDENVKFIKKYDEAAEHLIFAGSDIILSPSFLDSEYQLSLKAMKYGAAPVALSYSPNEMRHIDDTHRLEGTRLSRDITSAFANMSLSQAIDEIKSDPAGWNERLKDAMAMDFSWHGECYEIHHAAYSSIKTL